jgi:hypothetical protein
MAYETHGPCTVTSIQNPLCNGGTGSFTTLGSKGHSTVSLLKSGVELASITYNLKDVPAFGNAAWELTTGVEGDDGSTATKIKWKLNQADLNAQLYSIKIEASGKFELNTQMAFFSGNGVAVAEDYIIDNA